MKTGLLSRFIPVTKPGIVFGNLVSVTGGFLLAARGRPDFRLFFSVLAGTALVIASGCVLNNCIDRALDRKMVRTQHRALACGLISPSHALIYASILGLAGVLILWFGTNLLCLGIVLAGLVVYAGPYSLFLKRRSVFGTWVGSLAGAAPPLAGYCAVSGRFDIGALILLVTFSLWQIPHADSIALCHINDCTLAALPVPPVLRGIPSAKKQIVACIPAVTLVASLLTLTGYTGLRYLAAVLAAGIAWLVLACVGYRADDSRAWARRMFIFSIIDIVVLNGMMAIDYTP